MKMKKAILRNSKIVIFDKKDNFTAAQVKIFFLQPAGSETDFFSRQPGQWFIQLIIHPDLSKLQVLLLYISIPLLLSENAVIFIYYRFPCALIFI